MSFFVLYDPLTTQVTGRCDSTISPPPPGSHYIEVASAEEMMQTFPPGWCVVDGKLVAPLPPTQAQILETQKLQATYSLRAQCSKNIEGGFSHHADTVVYYYPSRITDQLNLNSASDNGGSLWRETQNSWEFVMHSPAQAQQVRQSLWTHIQSCQQQLQELITSVDNATSLEQINAITWVPVV
jgi:hypothetical protein